MTNNDPNIAANLYAELMQASERVEKILGQLSELGEAIGNDAYFNYAYNPSNYLLELIEAYGEIVTYPQYGKTVSGQEKGILLEQITNEVFECLKIAPITESFRSTSEQLDLVIFSDDKEAWERFLRYMGLDPVRNEKIIVEAKNWKEKVDGKTMRSFCYIVEFKYKTHCGLGIIFTRNKATGFESSQPKLGDARAVQMIFHASTSKSVVVFDHEDIMSLGITGEFPRRLKRKINDVEDVITDHREQYRAGNKWPKMLPIKPDYLLDKKLRIPRKSK